ncbi:MAG: hypothetical protein WED07_10045 [Candidatus Freyarchaeum deiterrae]
MSIDLVSVVKTLLPFVTPLVTAVAKSTATWLSKKFGDKIKAGKLEQDLIKAVDKGRIEDFIKEYKKYLSEEDIKRIRAIAGLRDLFDKAKRILESKKYTIDAANTFTDLAKTLEDVTTGISFEEAGIKAINVLDSEVNEEIAVTSEEYIVALLLRFAAVVWTQLAMKLTPSMEGWALEYDASIKVVLAPPTLALNRAMAAEAKEERDDEAKKAVMGGSEFLKFRGDYLSLMQFYREGIAIRNQYLEAVSCLKTAQLKVRVVQGKQKIHKHMTPSHLDGLVSGFRGEAQFWQFNISENLPQLAETVINFYNNNQQGTKKYLQEHLEVSKEEFNEFLDCLNLYQNTRDGFAGALKLYKYAAEKCTPGKDMDMIQGRIVETQKRASNNPKVLVPDSKPIL